MEAGIDRLNLHSVQLGYLKILQMGNADPNNTKQENNTRANKDRIARPAYQLANQNLSSLYTTHSKSAGGNHRSVIFRVRQPITARWSSDTTNQSVTTSMIALDFSGTTNQSASHNVALKQVIKSICQSGSRCMHVCEFNIQFKMHTIQYVKTECKLNQLNMLYHVIHIIISSNLTTSITAMFTLKLLNLLNSYLQQLKSTSTDSHKGTVQTTEASQLPPATKFMAGTPWNSNLYQSTSQLLNLARNHLPKIAQHPKNAMSDFSRNIRTPEASRSNSQVVLQPLMGYVIISANRYLTAGTRRNAKTQRFYLIKRRHFSSATGSSNQQLVTQSQHLSHKVTTDQRCQQKSMPKMLTNTCRSLANSRAKRNYCQQQPLHTHTCYQQITFEALRLKSKTTAYFPYATVTI
ncbi:hypothetical protein F511_42475 [Dorcoceras hygrometricum]|uniref:Uncharacterized protein n=1 Tax=Dorcoceras hygrometricum TaxID=472368 RepID=A0A2Z7D0L3_9LAMI|nr:hypothetical protein F511_42475 [Dorcoceras hygrometricum]